MGKASHRQGPRPSHRTRRVKLYVGNLAYDTTEHDLLGLFAPLGAKKAYLNVSTETGFSCGYGFIEFDDDDAARSARSIVDGKELGGRPLRVNMAKEKPKRRPTEG